MSPRRFNELSANFCWYLLELDSCSSQPNHFSRCKLYLSSQHNWLSNSLDLDCQCELYEWSQLCRWSWSLQHGREWSLRNCYWSVQCNYRSLLKYQTIIFLIVLQSIGILRISISSLLMDRGVESAAGLAVLWTSVINLPAYKIQLTTTDVSIQ